MMNMPMKKQKMKRRAQKLYEWCEYLSYSDNPETLQFAEDLFNFAEELESMEFILDPKTVSRIGKVSITGLGKQFAGKRFRGHQKLRGLAAHGQITGSSGATPLLGQMGQLVGGTSTYTSPKAGYAMAKRFKKS